MTEADVHTLKNGTTCLLAVLDEEERSLVEELRAFARHDDNWAAFTNFYVGRVGAFYKSRGLLRSDIIKSPVWKLAQDIAGRLHIAQGQARPSDYRDELETLIETEFGTRREFCQATGLSEDMLSHVLAKRKDFGIQTLSDALAKIGYTIHIAPLLDASSTSE